MENISIEAIRMYFERLSKREWMIIGGVSIGLVLLGVIIAYISLYSAISKMERKIARTEEMLTRVIANSKVYQNAHLKSLELDLLLSKPGESMSTFLEKSVKAMGISIESIQPKNAPPNDIFQENRVEVKIRKITLDELVELLYRIESHPQYLRVSSLNAKPRYDDPSYLNIVFSVSSFGLKQGV